MARYGGAVEWSHRYGLHAMPETALRHRRLRNVQPRLSESPSPTSLTGTGSEGADAPMRDGTATAALASGRKTTVKQEPENPALSNSASESLPVARARALTALTPGPLAAR